MNPVNIFRGKVISLIVILIALTTISPSPVFSQAKENVSIEKKAKVDSKKIKQLNADESIKRRNLRREKMKGRKRVIVPGRFNILPTKMIEEIAKSSQSAVEVDADFGGLYLIKSIFINADTTGQNFINIILEALVTKPSVYHFNLEILDKAGKELAKISAPISASGRKLRKGQALLGRFKIEEAIVAKITDYAISINISADPVLKSGGLEVLKVKAK